MKAAKEARPRTRVSAAVTASPAVAPAEEETTRPRTRVSAVAKARNAAEPEVAVQTGLLTANERRGLYMMWYDDSAKKPSTAKIEEAVEAYMKHFHARPNVVLVNENDRTDVTGVHVRSASYVRRDNFWVGYEEAA
jgi:hypothetical protein